MKDPDDLLVPLSPWSQQHIALEQQRTVDVSQASARVARALEARLGVSLTAPSLNTSSAGPSSLGSKMVLAGLGLFGAGALVGSAVTWQVATRAPPVGEVRQYEPLPVTEPPAFAPAPLAEPVKPIPPTPTTRRRVPTPPTEDLLVEETLMLEQARTALLRGEASAALSTLDAHRRRYPEGQMVLERDGLAIQALAALGRKAEAAKALETFAQKYPASTLIPRLREIVGVD